MKWRHQEEAKSTMSDKDDVTHDCVTSAFGDSVKTASEGVVAAQSNCRKPASIMSVADILDLRVAGADAPPGDDVTSGQNGVDPRRL